MTEGLGNKSFEGMESSWFREEKGPWVVIKSCHKEEVKIFCRSLEALSTQLDIKKKISYCQEHWEEVIEQEGENCTEQARERKSGHEPARYIVQLL